MLSKYFEAKVKTQKFDDDLLWSMGEIKHKKVLLFGAGEEFLELNKKYDFKNTLNIVGITDPHFGCCTCHDCTCHENFEGIKTIIPDKISEEDFDVILITNENPKPILNYLFNDLKIENKDIRTVFNEEIPDERENWNYLCEYHFDKTLPKTIKELKGMSVILYGDINLIDLVKRNFDISHINIIGISGNKFLEKSEYNEFFGYKVYNLEELKQANADYLLVASQNYVEIIEDLYYNKLKNSRMKFKPLVKKSFFTLFKEIFTN